MSVRWVPSHGSKTYFRSNSRRTNSSGALMKRLTPRKASFKRKAIGPGVHQMPGFIFDRIRLIALSDLPPCYSLGEEFPLPSCRAAWMTIKNTMNLCQRFGALSRDRTIRPLYPNTAAGSAYDRKVSVLQRSATTDHPDLDRSDRTGQIQQADRSFRTRQSHRET